MTQISDTEKQQVLAQVLNSPEFHDSKRYQELLTYLVEKSASGSQLKEMEIAHDLFGKDSTFDPATDPLIRSYISNLRKKLEHYYLTTKDRYVFRLEIPKGQYLVAFTRVQQSEQRKRNGRHTPWISIGIISLLVLLLAYEEYARRTSRPPGTAAVNPIWTDFLKERSQPTLLVLGDYLFLSERGKAFGRTFLRDPRINSTDELRLKAEKDPARYGALEISDVSFVGAGTSLGLPRLLQVIGTSPEQVSIKLSSQLKWDDLENHDVVYVGSFKTLFKLDTLFSRTNVRYRLSPNALEIIEPSLRSSKSYDLQWRSGNYQKDYSVVLKLSGPKNHPILFLTGFSEIGIMDAIRTATDPDLASRVQKFNGKDMARTPLLFELVSEAEGVRYTVFRSHIEHFEMLEAPRGSEN